MKKKKSHKSKRSSGMGKTSPVKILIDVALGIGGFLAANFASNTIKGEESISDAGFKVLIPQAAGVISPVVKPALMPVAIGSALSALMILMSQNPDKKSAMVDSKLMRAGEDDSESIDLSDLAEDQREMLGRYLITGKDQNSDPLGSGQVLMTGADRVIMTGDVSDPLS